MIELANRYLLAGVDAETGLLTSLSGAKGGPNLIQAPRLVYCEKEGGTWHGYDALRTDLIPIPCLGVTQRADRITARFQDENLAMEIRYTLPAASSLLVIETKVRGCARKATGLTQVALPGFTWAADFLDAFVCQAS